jgi:hypothetical protein
VTASNATPPAGQPAFGRWSAADLAKTDLPHSLWEPVVAANLPTVVGGCFELAERPQSLAEFADEAGLSTPDDVPADLLRLGTDHGSELCLDGSGTVRSVFCTFAHPARMVNSSFEAWLACSAEVRRFLADSADAPIGPGSARAAEVLRSTLTELDSDPLADPDSWWSLVTDDLRLTASVAAAGIFEFRSTSGALRTAKGYTLPGQGHVERRLWASLESRGVTPDQVTRIHTDLEPCMLPGGYCADWTAMTFPQAEVTFSFRYGPDAPGREAGVEELIRYIEESRA